MIEKSLFIFLHGIGRSGAQLIPLPYLGPPTSRTPGSLPGRDMHCWCGHQWFSTEGSPLDPAEVMAAREASDGLIDDVVQRLVFADTHVRIAFVEVSQGSIVALVAVGSGRWKVGEVVFFAGVLPPQKISSVSRETPILLVLRQADTTIPYAACPASSSTLKSAIEHPISSADVRKARFHLHSEPFGSIVWSC